MNHAMVGREYTACRLAREEYVEYCNDAARTVPLLP